MEIKTLIKCLRCTVSPQGTSNCKECPYRHLEKKGNFPAPADIVIDGVEYYEECDYEKISLDSADMLERILNNDCYQIGYEHGEEDKARGNEEIAENICDNFCKYRDTCDDNNECEYMRENDGKCPLDSLMKGESL